MVLKNSEINRGWRSMHFAFGSVLLSRVENIV